MNEKQIDAVAILLLIIIVPSFIGVYMKTIALWIISKHY